MALLWRSSAARLLSAAVSVAEQSMRVLGVVLILFGGVLIAGCVALYYYFLLPYHYPQWSVASTAHFAVSVWLLVNIAFHYVMACASSPGTPPRNDVEGLEEAQAKYPKHYRYCKHCKGPKPPRTHHCSICQRCVYRYDHHCPWLNNCVGLQNHRYFVLFLLYLTIGCLYFDWFAWTPFRALATNKPLMWAAPYVTRSVISFTFVLAAAMCFSVGSIGAWHLYLVSTAQTSIELLINRENAADARLHGEIFTNEYDLGTWRNFRVFFNISPLYPWWMLLLPVAVPPISDGTSYPTVRTAFAAAKSPSATATSTANADDVAARMV